MSSLGAHWVFSPFRQVIVQFTDFGLICLTVEHFRIILTTAQIDYLIIHWCGFLLDLTIGFWLLYDFTRPVAMVFCAMFHLMNSRMFSIGKCSKIAEVIQRQWSPTRFPSGLPKNTFYINTPGIYKSILLKLKKLRIYNSLCPKIYGNPNFINQVTLTDYFGYNLLPVTWQDI